MLVGDREAVGVEVARWEREEGQEGGGTLALALALLLPLLLDLALFLALFLAPAPGW